jgi:hypothetical protein
MKEWNEALMEEINIDTEALVEAVDAKTKHAIFEDSYGDGIALVDGVSYKTYHDLAAAFGLDAADFAKDDAAGWNVGDTYYIASGELHGRPWDLGELGEECRTEDEAKENAGQWLSDLTEQEKKHATVFTGRFRITAIDDDGSIGCAESY